MVVTALVGLFLVLVGFASALEAVVVLGMTPSQAVRLRSTELAVPLDVTELLFVLLTEAAAAAAAVVVVVVVAIILVVTVVVALIDTADV